MVGNALHNIQDLLFLRAGIISDKLEGAEQLGGQKFAGFLSPEVLQRHVNCSGGPTAVDCGNRMVLEGDTAKKNLGAVKLKDGI